VLLDFRDNPLKLTIRESIAFLRLIPEVIERVPLTDAMDGTADDVIHPEPFLWEIHMGYVSVFVVLVTHKLLFFETGSLETPVDDVRQSHPDVAFCFHLLLGLLGPNKKAG
jgi:hypothetical protein